MKQNEIKKDWTGDTNSIFKTLGASNHSPSERANYDFYATDPIAATLLLELEIFSGDIWECACGEGHLSRTFTAAGYNVKSTDLIDRGFGTGNIDFLSPEISTWSGNIVTNPPYAKAKDFVEKALSIIPDGNKVAMFLKLQFMESKGRKQFFIDNPPKKVWVSSSRLNCGKNGNFDSGGSAVCYAWFIWEKGFSGITELGLFN